MPSPMRAERTAPAATRSPRPRPVADTPGPASTVRASRLAAGAGGATRLVALQRLAGNSAVTALLAADRAKRQDSGPPSAGIGGPEIGAATADPGLEAEADRAADAASRTSGSPDADRAPTPTSADAAGGRPLSDPVRRDAERHYGKDFGGVRIRSDDDRVHLAGAKAITSGQQIAVAPQVGDIESPTNRHLLNHELAHVAQQSGGSPRRGLSATTRTGQPAPTVTAVNAPAELGSGKSANVTAVAAGAGALTWTLVGAPAGVTIVPRGRRGATIRSAPTPIGTPPPGAGTNFQATAALTATPGDSATSGNVLFVGVNSVAVAPSPAMIPVPRAGGNTAPPANILDPNRDGMTGNTGVVTPVTGPAGRPVTITLPVAAGAAVSGTTVTPGTTTGPIRVRAQDNATGTFNELAMRIDSMPTKVTRIGPAGAPPAGIYGSINPIQFGATDSTVPSTRVIGETITAGGSDAFGLTAGINATGPNPAPQNPLSAPANGWADQLFTPQAAVDANRFIGKNAPGGSLPAVWQLRQGFHAFGWNGVRAPTEFDNGFHIRSLVRVGNGLFFRTEHKFPGGGVVAPLQPYAAVNPLIVFTNIALVANAPAAVGGVAADGVATGNATVVSTVPGRNVVWSVVSDPLAIPAAPVPVGTPAVTQAGLVAGSFPVKVADALLPNREAVGNVRLVPVALSRLAAAPATVPAGTNSTNLTVNAAPGGRTVTWTVDAASAAAGVTVVGVAAAPAVATTAVLTRPAGFTGTVTVSAADNVLPAKKTSLKVKFL